MTNQIFRQKALERLASPEQLDVLMQVTSPRSWLALLGIAVLLTAAVVWGFVGTIPTRVEAQGVLINTGGVRHVFANGPGPLAEIMVREGDIITAGQLVARIDQPHLPTEQIPVTSPHSGRVLELQVSRGDIVDRGRALFSLQVDEGNGEQLEAVIYVPSKDGKHVLPGMEAQISPLSAPREEFGFIIGNVTYVSEFPATRAGMMRVLANDVLVQSLSSDGAPFAAYASLTPTPGQAGSYRWSSPKGETLKVGSGTPCMVTITVRQQRPIDLVIPFLREKVGLD
jgi:multidrug efflux pump subunit AcrA (membrane-fusion protein)